MRQHGARFRSLPSRRAYSASLRRWSDASPPWCAGGGCWLQHAFDDQVGHGVQAFGIQVLQLWHQCQVGRQVAGDVFAQGADGLTHREAAAVLLTHIPRQVRRR